ncbi:Transposase [Rubellimicrobium thermophilum DSM 16684]|uniref:Transposase n=1 Tax=Rubellimicrobium thermophilum DSM 16684 TaxID=1123069 RepID=S9R797_9RHOB|nr:Transposase [Rubellimicrobium thermophilum DSM 16684]
MEILDDVEWGRLKGALDAARSGTGRPMGDERRVIESVIWRQRNGAKWRSLPSEFGPWWKAAQMHIRWSRSRVWERAFEHLREAGRPDLGEVFLDGISVRAHHKAAGAKGGGLRHALGRSRGGFGTKALGVADAKRRAVLFLLLPGQASEVRAGPAVLELLCPLGPIGRVVCDRGYSSDPGATPSAPSEPSLACPASPPIPGPTARPRRLLQTPPRREPLGTPQGNPRHRHPI